MAAFKPSKNKIEIFLKSNNSFTEILPGLQLSGIVSIIGALALSSLRIGSFFIASPLFGYRIIPLQARIVVSFAISFLIYDDEFEANVCNPSVRYKL